MYKVGYFLTRSSIDMQKVELFEIKDILIASNLLYVVCQQWQILEYTHHFASFKVAGECNKFSLTEIDTYDGPPVHLYNVENTNYIRLKKYFM